MLTHQTKNSSNNIKFEKKEYDIKKNKHLIFVTMAIQFFFFLIGHLELIFTYIITLAIPIHLTIKDYILKDEDFFKMWGSYYIAFIIFFIFDIFHRIIIKFIPLYFFIRTTILLFLYHPLYKGAMTFYSDIFIELFRLTGFFKIKFNKKDSMLSELEEKLKTEKKTN